MKEQKVNVKNKRITLISKRGGKRKRDDLKVPKARRQRGDQEGDEDGKEI